MGSTERLWDDAVRMGVRNRKWVELARRHCVNMEFVPSGGRGMAEEATGLPIDMRQVRCPVALGGMASNLPWVMTDFYRENCVGCAVRRPTGEVPNLATAVEEADAAAAAGQAAEEADLVRRRGEWQRRADGRRSLASTSGEAMAGVLRDVDVLDGDPASPATPTERDAARARAAALADRAPALFSPEVVAACLAAVSSAGAFELLDALRRLAVGREEFAADVAAASIKALKAGPVAWAGRCVAELSAHVDPAAMEDCVCRSLVLLAGAPERDRIGRSRPGRANDPTGLLAVAKAVPDRVQRVLASMLPPPVAPSGLVLPRSVPPGAAVNAWERAAAAAAVRTLAPASPALAAALVRALVLDLAIEPDDEYDDPAVPAIQRTLAALLVQDIGDVAGAVDGAGRRGGEELRERLIRVLAVAADMASDEPRQREPGDPTPDADRCAAVRDVVFQAAAALAGGDWGDDARFGGAELIETLVEQDPDGALGRLPSLLGALLGLFDAHQRAAVFLLDPAPGTVSETERFFGRMNRDSAFNSAISRVVNAVEVAAAAGPARVCGALADLIADERDLDRGSDLLWWLLRSLGKIGRRYGGDVGVIRHVLPVLHSYLVSGEPHLRARAIDAWTEIEAAHPLPSSLRDLLPALLADRNVGVARAVARASRLDWSEAEQARFLVHALGLIDGVDPATNADAVKDGLAAARRLSALLGPDISAKVQARVVDAAGRLDGYDLRDALRGQWLPETARSAPMARLRLRQAADLQINDRWNAGDDEELCALLACGPGLAGVGDADLRQAALDLAPDGPLAAAEFAEAAWRAGRPAAAAQIMQDYLGATPDRPAYASHRALVELVRDLAEVDALAASGSDWQSAAKDARRSISALDADGASDARAKLARSATAAAAVRDALAAASAPAQTDPAVAARSRADALSAAAKALAAASQRATDTCGYLRAIAGACEAAAFLLRAEGAVLDADSSAAAAAVEAATRRARAVVAELEERFAVDDPLAAPLRSRLEAIADLPAGAPAGPVLAKWPALPLPLPIVEGPRRRVASRGTPPPDREQPQAPVAVALASLDGLLVTGPEVLRPGRVYDLRLEVQTGPWPDWADRLDAELLTHLTPAEITVPELTWACGDHDRDHETYTKAGPLVLRFALGPGQPAPPLLVRLAWRGTADGKPVTQALDVTGHRELRLRPYDPTRDRTTDYPVFDERLLAIYDALARSGHDPDQLQAFCRLLTSICRVGLRMTWDKKYRRGTRVSERQFHDDLHARLLADPELGGRVERGSPAALGYLDVRHDGITAELKVERAVAVTPDSAPKYMGQATQYASADGTRLSILTILDMSPKQTTVGTPENYLFTLEPRLHGLDNPEAPSLVAVIVVNGNLPPPSSWSRRKPPKKPAPN